MGTLAGAWGIHLGIRVAADGEIEALYTRQPTELRTDGLFTGEPLFDLTLETWQLGVLEGDEGLHRPVGVGRVGEAEVRQPVHEGADRLRRPPGPGRGASERYFDCLNSVARCPSRSASARSARRRAPSLSRVACALRSIAL
jgi:hypothetical protein